MTDENYGKINLAEYFVKKTDLINATTLQDGLMSSADKIKLDNIHNIEANINWNNITNKPNSFTPSDHTHQKSDITNFNHSHGEIDENGVIDNGNVGDILKLGIGKRIVASADITVDNTVTENSSNPVKSSGIYEALSQNISTHNQNSNAHSDIRVELNNKADSNHTHTASNIIDSSLNNAMSNNFSEITYNNAQVLLSLIEKLHSVMLYIEDIKEGLSDEDFQSFGSFMNKFGDIVAIVEDVYGEKIEDEEEYLEFTFTGITLTQYSGGSFSGTDMTIDYDDGTVETTTGTFGHTYAENGTYTVKIYDVTSLGTNCFRSCTGLTSINIPSSVTSLGTNCFEDCTGLISVSIPNSITSIGGGCFDGCTGLTSVSIPNSVTSIEEGCFYNCTNLTSINIPNTVTSLGNYCFKDCIGLTSIILNWTTSNQIVAYNPQWIASANANLKFEIPIGTTSLYTTKKYPSDKLQEVN